MSATNFSANGIYHVISRKASKGVQTRNAASDDEQVDIWWPDIFIDYSMVNWILPELYI
jgi:hypothetical protein